MSPILLTHLPAVHPGEDHQTLPVWVDRHTLQKKLWRATAEDGQEFALDLQEPTRHGVYIYQQEGLLYQIAQTPEPVLEVAIPTDPSDAAQLGWMIGNQHLPVEVCEKVIRLEAVHTVMEFFKRQHISFAQKEEVFQPSPHSRHAGHHH